MMTSCDVYAEGRSNRLTVPTVKGFSNYQVQLQSHHLIYIKKCSPKSPKSLANASLVRGKLQEPAAGTILDHPDGAVLVLPDTAHALTHGDALGLLGRVTSDGHAHDPLRAEASDEGIARPAGKQAALVDDHAGRGDDGDPEGLGRGDIRARAVLGDLPAVVVAALGHERPAVVGARLDQVELVAAHGAHLDLPEAALRVPVDAQRVAVAQRPDLRLHGALAGKGVAREGGAVVVQLDHLAQVGGHGLGRGHLVDLARRDPQRAVRAEEQAAGELEPARGPLRVAPDDLEAGQRAAPVGVQRQLGPRDRAARTAGASLGVADIHQTVVSVVGVQGDVVQTALAGVGDGGHTSDGARGLGGRVDETHVASSLVDEHALVGQEGERPWLGVGGDDCRREWLLASVQLLRWDGQSTSHQRQSVGDRKSEMHHVRGGLCF